MVRLDGEQVGDIALSGDVLTWMAPGPVSAGSHYLEITVVDRAANRAVRGLSFSGGGGNSLPTVLKLGNNYPNPFNPETAIPFSVPQDLSAFAGGAAPTLMIRLAIYNAMGQMVRLLLDDQEVRPGRYEAIWDGRDDSGRKAASGVYLYRVEGGTAVVTKRMTLLK